jgi:thiosulfate/3-mercaptopyruvate sulfurtransferase
MAGFAHPDWLVDPDWLEKRLDDPTIRIVDCDNRDAYRRAHIPGAVGVADNYFKNPDDRTFIMEPDQFADTMSRMGIGDDTEVVAYDGFGSLYAGRLWWCLNYYGHARVRVLDGGWNRWLLARKPITIDEPHPARAVFTPRVNEESRATAEHILANLGRPDFVVLDVRSDGEWDGSNARGNKRAGHIPGAVHIEWLNNVTDDAVKALKSADELREMFAAAGVTPEKEVVTV